MHVLYARVLCSQVAVQAFGCLPSHTRTNMSYQIRTMPLLMIRTVEAIHQHVSQRAVIPQKNADDIHVELVNDLRDLSEHYLIRS